MPDGDVYALDDVSLHVRKGEFLAIVGTSGSGKSTLMNMLGCLDKPTSGSYFLNGEDVLAKKPRELARIRNREIGFIFQGFNLLEKMTALENVEIPMMYAHIPRKQRRELAKDALSRVGLSKRLYHLPCELSGGQQQRVAIARAITRTPSVILADEPTGNLDKPTTNEILKIIKELNAGGTTVVLITHDSHVAECAGRVIEISEGKIK
ncbi:MAG: ABC transporter ATP-binding protein [Oscillospiraceae bacterium]|nr:ABC transporter ATP-binding protein [Oscillospiraceae bacterium]MBQ3225108.1 ABC transporter ATP-binding protein [Oscillospiraceae bacterium]MBQ4315850.1 ABC transporter ATP-binding protein [Oscillospiraceae bacterium]